MRTRASTRSARRKPPTSRRRVLYGDAGARGASHARSRPRSLLRVRVCFRGRTRAGTVTGIVGAVSSAGSTHAKSSSAKESTSPDCATGYELYSGRLSTFLCGSAGKVARALLLVDVIKNFLHEDGDRLLESYRERHPALRAALRAARAASERVVYANDVCRHLGAACAFLEHVEGVEIVRG